MEYKTTNWVIIQYKTFVLLYLLWRFAAQRSFLNWSKVIFWNPGIREQTVYSCLVWIKTIYKSKGVVNSHARSKLKTFKASSSKKLTFSFKLYCLRFSKRRMVYLNVRPSLHLKVPLGKLKLLFIVGMELNTKILKWNFNHAAFLSNKIFYKVLQQIEVIFQTRANLCTWWVENSLSISSRPAVLVHSLSISSGHAVLVKKNGGVQKSSKVYGNFWKTFSQKSPKAVLTTGVLV